ncbi:hypothetical protein KC973_03045 [Candidatus Saccharibacteria bacterium]|nr:hypothetical protein [Candidatus Saccharibacteria bacterium]
MNNAGRDKIWNALLDADLAIGITPLPTQDPSRQYDTVEIFARHPGHRNPTPRAVSALAHAGLLHISDLKSIELTGGDTPQLELVQELHDDHLLSGDKRLFFADRTVVLR